MTNAVNIAQLRQEFNVGEEFHVFAGVQLEPNERMVVGHSHEYDHLMVLLRPPGPGPEPEYAVGVEGRDGKAAVRHMKPYGLAVIKAGSVHWVEQTVPGAKGGFACIFARRNADGSLRPDPKREAGHG